MKAQFKPGPYTKFAIKHELVAAKLMKKYDTKCTVDSVQIDFENRGPIEVVSEIGMVDTNRIRFISPSSGIAELCISVCKDEQITLRGIIVDV